MSALSSLKSNRSGKKQILFIAEAVTLAHVARPLVLAHGLDPTRYDITLAVDPRYEKLYASSDIPRVAIHSIPSSQFAKALRNGRPLYSAKVLEQYVQADLALIRELRPDVIVGDMRLSLAVSARLARVPYVNLTNSYWSPFAQVHFPVPQTWMTSLFGVNFSQKIFDLVRPLIFSLHTRPMYKVMRKHKLPWSGKTIQRVYSEADHVLYADLPGLTPMEPLPAHHHYIGPLLWEPPPEALKDTQAVQVMAKVDALESSDPKRPVVYINLGSSGPANLLAKVLDALKHMHATLLAATAGKVKIAHPPTNALIADFLPGLQACQKADLVICNGGSPSTQQAIAAGKPMLCLPSNLDQFLNTQGLVNAGAAVMVRADQVSTKAIQQSIKALMTNDSFAAKAQALCDEARKINPIDELTDVLKSI